MRLFGGYAGAIFCNDQRSVPHDDPGLAGNAAVARHVTRFWPTNAEQLSLLADRGVAAEVRLAEPATVDAWPAGVPVCRVLLRFAPSRDAVLPRPPERHMGRMRRASSCALCLALLVLGVLGYVIAWGRGGAVLFDVHSQRPAGRAVQPAD